MPEMNSIASKIYPPHPTLRPYVSAYLFTELSEPLQWIDGDATPLGYSIISFALQNTHIFNGKERITSPFNITGQLTRHHPLRMYHSFSMVYILFHPFGAYRLLGLSQHLLTDACSDLTAVMGRDAPGIRDRLLENAHDHRIVIDILEQWLLHRWQQTTPPHKVDAIEYACTLLKKNKGMMPLSKLCKTVEMSERSIERHFQEKIGVGPKKYSRIIRFNRALQVVQSGYYQSWNDVVYGHQYFDQAHFINEFRAFSGYTPSEMHSRFINMRDFVGHQE